MEATAQGTVAGGGSWAQYYVEAKIMSSSADARLRTRQQHSADGMKRQCRKNSSTATVQDQRLRRGSPR